MVHSVSGLEALLSNHISQRIIEHGLGVTLTFDTWGSSTAFCLIVRINI